jgi:hypothetical protein
MMNLYTGVFLTIIFSQVLIMTTLISNVQANSLNPGIYSTDESPFGIPYPTWIARWWNWTAGISNTEHPRDFAERTCDVSQSWKDVWFLPDILNGKIVRECQVPHGKAIFIPITTGEQSIAESEEFRGKPLNEVKDSLIKGASYCDNYNTERVAEIDGQKIQGLEGNSPYRTNTSELFNLTWGENNIYDVKPQTSPAFAEGWFLFVKPLPQGDHIIKVHSKISNPTDVSCDYAGDTEWKIKVK